MKTRSCIAPLVLAAFAAAFAAPVSAQEPTQSLPTVRAETVLHVVDCHKRSLPSQREVGEWTGQRNFSQVYETRKRLMVEVGRNCKSPGIEQVQVVSRTNTAAQGMRLVAVNARRSH